MCRDDRCGLARLTARVARGHSGHRGTYCLSGDIVVHGSARPVGQCVTISAASPQSRSCVAYPLTDARRPA